MGIGIEKLFNAVIEHIPPPVVQRDEKFRALLFDSWYDRFRGALSLIYVTDGSVKLGDSITSYHTKKSYEIKTLSLLKPHEENVDKL